MNGCSEIIRAAEDSARALVEQLESNRTDRFVIAETCFVVTRLDRNNKPLELVYYSIN